MTEAQWGKLSDIVTGKNISPPQTGFIVAALRYPAEQHEQNATFDFIIAVDRGKQTLDKVLIDVLVLE